MSEIKIIGTFAVPEGEKFKLLPCQGVELNEVHKYLDSIYNFSFKAMNIVHNFSEHVDYLSIEDVDIINMENYINFTSNLKESQYGKLFRY